MDSLVNTLLEFASAIWNLFIGISVDLFKVDAVTNSQYSGIMSTVHTCYNVVIDIAVPITVIFFLIGIIKDVEFAAPDQQPKMLWAAIVKFAIVLGLLIGTWDILTLVMSAANSLCQGLALSGTYEIDYNTSAVKSAVDTFYAAPLLDGFTLPPFTLFDSLDNTSVVTKISSFLDALIGFIPAVFGWLLEVLGEFVGILLVKIILVPLCGIIGIAVMVMSGISIFNSAAQRIIKPLVLLPFAGIGMAMGAGSGDYTRQASRFIRYYLGLCLSGSFMVVALNLGATLCTSVTIAGALPSSNPIAVILASLFQFCLMPIVTSGLVRSMDSVISHAFS